MAGQFAEAENGRDGIDKALQLCPDLILLDLAMPVMNEIEAARELRRLMPATPLLMFTTYTDSHLTRESLAVGIAAVAAKSDGAEALVTDIQQLFSARLERRHNPVDLVDQLFNSSNWGSNSK